MSTNHAHFPFLVDLVTKLMITFQLPIRKLACGGLTDSFIATNKTEND